MDAEVGRFSPEREISRGIVAIYKEYLGRGPTRAQTTITDSFVVTVLSDSLTKVEQRLAVEDDDETVRSIRRKFQSAMSHDIIELVERATNRKAGVFLSDHDVPTDTAIEFVTFKDAAVSAQSNGEVATSTRP